MRYTGDLSVDEVYNALKETDIAYIPIGSTEGHGYHLPMSTDTYVAEAVSLLASEKTGGLVYPPIHYSFAGATSSFKGTVTIPLRLLSELVKEVAKCLWSQGFRKIFFVSIHGPNEIALKTAVRELYEYDEVLAVYFNPYSVIREKVLREGFDEAWLEASVLYAALKVLGKSHLIKKYLEKKSEEKKIQIPGLGEIAKRGGYTGFRYVDFTQHLPWRPNIDPEKGLELLKEAADTLVELSISLEKYINYLKEKSFKYYI
ncbi:MAG: hypothetical protein DRN04_06250 [Thermoprotei archaeon]|nr:MAG: hypothetical protein DRN04_06250 [Thermoprotei archaeon]